MADYDSLVLGGYYSEKYLKQSGEIKNNRAIGKIYDLVLDSDKSPSDSDVTHWEVGEDDSYVFQVVERGRAEQDIFIQDQVTNPVLAKFNAIKGFTFFSGEVTVGEYEVTIDDVTNFAADDYVIAYDQESLQYYVAYILSVDGNVLTLDTPFDYPLPAGTLIKSTTTNMGVNGETTPIAYGLRGVSEQYPFEKTFDITRIIFNCETEDKCDLSTFGDLDRLTRGLVFRKKNGNYKNIFNVKTNGELAGIMYDITIESAQNSQQGQNGFYARLTFAGQSKLGVALRLESGEDIEFLVQDDLSDITLLEVMAEGHEVSDGVY